jgi:hypothetical protein
MSEIEELTAELKRLQYEIQIAAGQLYDFRFIVEDTLDNINANLTLSFRACDTVKTKIKKLVGEKK